MFVIDLLKRVNLNDVIERLSLVPWFFDEIDYDNRLTQEEKIKLKEKAKKMYLDEFEKIIKREDILYNERKILFIHKRFGNDEFYDCSEINLDDIDNILKNIKITDFEDALSFKNPLKGVIFLKRNEILGFKVSEQNILKINEINAAAAIFYCLTTFSINEEIREEKKEEIIKSLENFEKNKEQKYYTMDDIYEMLGFEKEKETNIEKARKRNCSLCDTLKDIFNLIYDIQELLVYENIITDDFNKEEE